MTMFNPSRDQVRHFFIDSWHRYQQQQPLEAMQAIAARTVADHPEYHALLNDEEALQKEFLPEHGQLNPFLHMSLHMAIEEQLSIDQPAGIRQIFEQLCVKLQDRHQAMHIILECLGETLFEAQSKAAAPDNEAYLECIRQCQTWL